MRFTMDFHHPDLDRKAGKSSFRSSKAALRPPLSPQLRPGVDMIYELTGVMDRNVTSALSHL